MERQLSAIVQKEEEGMSLQRFLHKRLGLTTKEISRAKFREKGICVNQKRRKVKVLLHQGDVVEVQLETRDQKSAQLLSAEGSLSILYEDQDVIVVDKPSGLVVHPSGFHYTDTLANRLASYLREKGEDSVIRILGRLDKDTSGAVLAVKNRVAGARLERQREKGTFYKTYLAITCGYPCLASGWIREPIGADTSQRGRMKIDPMGKAASTWYETIKRIGNHSLIRLRLDTGRTHQIRVHMASISCPLMGDPLYGKTATDMKRTALHAESIDFYQPFTGEKLHVRAPLPEDMKKYFQSKTEENKHV